MPNLARKQEDSLSLSVIVLAAGQGVRMKSELPKVMHPLAGRPMVRYVVETARALEPACLVVVVGHGADLVRRTVGDGVTYAIQAERLGTGHAVQQAADAAAGQAGTVLVLFGDTPLVRPETLRRAVDRHQTEGAVVTMLSFRPADPTGYGRIVRNQAGDRVVAIVEERDATPQQRAIGEASSGIYCFHDGWLWPNLARLAADPALRAGH